MKAIIILTSAALAAFLCALALLVGGCTTGGHTVCYDGKCVSWTNSPADD